MNTIMTDVAYDPLLFSTNGNESQKAEKVAEEVESLFLYQLLKEMDGTIARDEDDLFYSQQEDTYRSLYHQELARTIAQGEGIGLKQTIAYELSKQQAGEDAQPTSRISLIG